jgi:hypothetical protein
VNARAFAGALAVALTVSALSAQTPPKIDTSVKAVVAATVAYVAAYQKDMAYVLADELAAQHVTGAQGAVIQERRTRAEFFLTFLPNEGTWIAVRDVREVDGVPVTGPDTVRKLLERAPLWRLGAVIAEKNPRFNIGSVRRTFNEPTIGLLVVNAVNQRRFKFDRASVSKTATPMVTMTFTERARPTLVMGVNGEPVFTHGELDIDAATGRVERTTIELALASVRARLSTTYALDAKLKLWVPSVMSERYESVDPLLSQTITVDTTYTNYRRFDTSVVIK